MNSIAQLYEAWEKQSQVVVWRQKLKDFDMAERKPKAEEKDNSTKP